MISNSRLRARFANLWEVSQRHAAITNNIVELLRDGDMRLRGRMSSISAQFESHGSRCLARLAAMGGCPLPVPVEEEFSGDVKENLGLLYDDLQCVIDAYAATACISRKAENPSAAWVCELNRAECMDIRNELTDFIEKLKAA